LQPGDAFTLRMREAVKGELGMFEEASQEPDCAVQLVLGNAFTVTHSMLGRLEQELERADTKDIDAAFDRWTLGGVQSLLSVMEEAQRDPDRNADDLLQPLQPFTVTVVDGLPSTPHS